MSPDFLVPFSVPMATVNADAKEIHKSTAGRFLTGLNLAEEAARLYCLQLGSEADFRESPAPGKNAAPAGGSSILTESEAETRLLHRGADCVLTDPQLLTTWMENHPEQENTPGVSFQADYQAAPLAALFRHFATAERMAFCRKICAFAAPEEESGSAVSAIRKLLGQPARCGKDARGRIAYQHNVYADAAFLRFSRALPDARAAYEDSFAAVCEQVFNGLCEYCILPLENSRDGKLVRFYGLIEKYELQIVLTSEVTTADNVHSTLFGLCRRGILYPGLLPEQRQTLSFEFVFWQEAEHATLGKLITAAESCGLRLSRVDCLPASDEEILLGIGHSYDICFDFSPESGNELNFAAFLLHLETLSPAYLPLGLYNRL